MCVERRRVHLRDRHLRRLESSAAILGIALPDRKRLIDAIDETLASNSTDDCIARLTITRGEGRGRAGVDAEACTLIVSLRPLLQYRNSSSRTKLAIVTTTHQRPETPTRIKSLSRLGYVLAAREARARGADEAVMLNADGYVAEGSVSNVFIVREGELITPPISLGILPGIARGRVLELARMRGYVVREEAFDSQRLLAADECFITNAPRAVSIVGSIDGVTLDASAPVSEALRAAYLAEIPGEAI